MKKFDKAVVFWAILLGIAMVTMVYVIFTGERVPDAKKWDIRIVQGSEVWYTDTFDNHGTCIEFFDYQHRHVLICGDYSASGRTEPKPEAVDKI